MMSLIMRTHFRDLIGTPNISKAFQRQSAGQPTDALICDEKSHGVASRSVSVG